VSLSVIAIVILSTFMHAGWNLIARYERSESQVYKKTLIFIGLVGFIPAVVSEIITRSMTPLAWACVTGQRFADYTCSLARLESSDLRSYVSSEIAASDLYRHYDTLQGGIFSFADGSACSGWSSVPPIFKDI
jgi:hypothetical protein